MYYMNTHLYKHTHEHTHRDAHTKKKKEQEKENEAELANGIADYLALTKTNPSSPNCFSHLSHGQKWSYLFTVLFGLARDLEWLRGNQ